MITSRESWLKELAAAKDAEHAAEDAAFWVMIIYAGYITIGLSSAIKNFLWINLTRRSGKSRIVDTNLNKFK